MAVFILPNDDSGRIVAFDLIEGEQHETVSEITDHPVENGVNVSDHVRPTPDRLSIAAYVTNTPIVVNPFTKRGEFRSVPMRVPQWEIPVEATPGSAFRGAGAAVGGAAPEAAVTILVFPDRFDAIRETYEVLQELQTNAVLLEVVTPMRVYEDMIIERVTAPRTTGDGGVTFGIDFKQLRVVESGQVAAPPVPADDVPGGKPLENKGAQGAKPPATGEDANKGGSIAFSLLNGQGLI